ncbi:MAG: glucose 1-dehydrogenase [Candidatus Obscuribacterales bacterium]
MKLKNKVALVTGASKGIGASIAKHLAAEGANVAVNYSSSKAGADKVVEEITKGGGKAVAIQADLSKPQDVARLFADTKKALGNVDILVNNAGVYEFSPLEEVSEEHFHKMFNLNVLGLLLASKEAAKQFGERGGSIINISSVASNSAMPSAAVYSATKAAVDSITRTLSAELGPKKIRVNSINPGMVITEGVQSAGIAGEEAEFRKVYEAAAPLGRVGQVDDIAPAAVFLASDEASWVTGETWRISGGFRN